MLTYGRAAQGSLQMVLLGGMAVCVETVYPHFAWTYPVLLEGAPSSPLRPPPPHRHHDGFNRETLFPMFYIDDSLLSISAL